MKPVPSVSRLGTLIAVLAVIAAAAGLFVAAGDGPASVTSVRGEQVDLFARGLYRYDSLFVGAGNRGTDAITLLIGVPLLLASLAWYRRGSWRGGVATMGALTYFLYVYATYSLGTAYNELYLLYVALFSASLFALLKAFGSFDVEELGRRLFSRTPPRGMAIFMFISGAVTLVVWLVAPVTAMLGDGVPAGLSAYTTLVTTSLDVAIIVPVAVVAGVWVWHRDPRWVLLAGPLLVLEAMLAPMIAAQTVSQLAAGITYTAGEVIGPLSGFLLLAVVAVGYLLSVLRGLPARGPSAP